MESNDINKTNRLKRSISTESLERALKRSRPFRNDSPNPSTEEKKTLYPNTSQVLKPVSISTRTSNEEYRKMNDILYTIHKERFGDPEQRESWWNKQEDVDMMEEDNHQYNAMNSVLKEAFLQRRNAY
ncbi:hypothetical protein CU098_011536 [Rhizopus stolonifer]|uniref:Uncharacterized protein n=1 Tax=Rhizopus stolonifer TaxID=4846 RepID=A0A367KI39_RHIST|nr:hypothetical protein CU098_011536 [Rhizopus stolonifer]